MRRRAKEKPEPVCYRKRRHRPRPSILVGWTKEDEDMMERAVAESARFMEKFCAGVGVPKLPIVNANHYFGFRSWYRDGNADGKEGRG